MPQTTARDAVQDGPPASARSSAKRALDAAVVNSELTLISIIQGLALGVLAAASVEPLVQLQWQAWPYVLTGLLVVLIFWRQVNEKLNSKGFDAWWLDASEPDLHSNIDIGERKARTTPTAFGPSIEYFNSYPLVHSEGVYRGSREVEPDKRVFILSRAFFAGQQRAAAAFWSGDIVPRWDDMREQISGLVNASMAGAPNVSFDIGGFSPEKRYESKDPAHLAEWRELNLRWFQYGAFVPIFRLHGQFPYREIWEIAPEGTPHYDSFVHYLKLRYTLLPYVYTLAADTWHGWPLIRP